MLNKNKCVVFSKKNYLVWLRAEHTLMKSRPNSTLNWFKKKIKLPNVGVFSRVFIELYTIKLIMALSLKIQRKKQKKIILKSFTITVFIYPQYFFAFFLRNSTFFFLLDKPYQCIHYFIFIFSYKIFIKRAKKRQYAETITIKIKMQIQSSRMIQHLYHNE